MGLRYHVVETALGWVGLVRSEQGLRHTTLPQPSPQAVRELLGPALVGAVEDGVAFTDLAQRMRRYFGGEKVYFPDSLDLSGVPLFHRAIWEKVRTIPYGETRSYAWAAGEVGKPRACRAVGQAMARNRLPLVVPCHRVVGSDGDLRGFGGGLALKRALLDLEARSY